MRTPPRSVTPARPAVASVSLARRRDAVMSSVIQDLRQPLVAMGVLLDVLRARELRAVEDVEVLEDLADLCARMERYVGELLITTTGRQAAHRRLVDPEIWVRRLVAPQELRARRNGVRIVLELSGCPDVVLDEEVLARSLECLVDNAMRFASSLVRISASVVGTCLHVAVENDGAPPDPAAIGDALHGERPRVTSGGLGIGLRSARAILEARGGALAFRANGRLTTFVVSLPCALASDF